MTIFSKIKQSIQRALGEDYSVYYMDDPLANLETGRMEFPCAIVNLIDSGNVVQEAGQVKERVSAAVVFSRLTQFDMDAEENEEILQSCKDDAFAWLLSLGSDPTLQLDSMTRTARYYDRYDDLVTGYALLAELHELEGAC